MARKATMNDPADDGAVRATAKAAAELGLLMACGALAEKLEPDSNIFTLCEGTPEGTAFFSALWAYKRALEA